MGLSSQEQELEPDSKCSEDFALMKTGPRATNMLQRGHGGGGHCTPLHATFSPECFTAP